MPNPVSKQPEGSELLRLRRNEARRRLQADYRDLKDDVSAALDLRAWADTRPWTTVVVAVGAGFVAANLVVPRKATPGSVPSTGPVSGVSPPPSSKRKFASAVWSTVLPAAYGAIRFVLTHVIEDTMRDDRAAAETAADADPDW